MLRKLLFMVYTVILFSINLYSQETKVRIGTFNIEWLGNGENDTIIRNDDDYKAISQIISTIDCDILAIQEVEDTIALQKVLKNCKNSYSFVIDPTSNNLLKTAILYKNSFSKLDVQFVNLSNSDKNHYNRPAIYLKLKVQNKDIEVITLHLKSNSKKSKDFKNAPEVRSKQVKELLKWIQDNGKSNSILIGDFNEEYSENGNLYKIEKKLSSDVVTKNQYSCLYTKKKSIDHLIVPSKLKTTIVENSIQMFNHNALTNSKLKRKISDHCLVFFTLLIP